MVNCVETIWDGTVSGQTLSRGLSAYTARLKRLNTMVAVANIGLSTPTYLYAKPVPYNFSTLKSI
jgi:hypothetical protein